LKRCKMKAKNFREIKGMPYTRREYIGGVPGSKIVKFTMGNPEGEFDYKVELLNLRDAQIRHNALEAARVAANRLLELRLGRENYLLKIKPYPHQVLREHKRINVAQADRFQEGMKKAYGKPVGVAARVERGDTIIFAEVPEGGVDVAKEALTRAGHKLPVPFRIMVEENNGEWVGG
jgi:large subunit ribosomal protein L10e